MRVSALARTPRVYVPRFVRADSSRARARERVTSPSPAPSKTRVKRDRERPSIPTVKSKKTAHASRWHGRVYVSLPYESSRERTRRSRSERSTSAREAFSGPPRPQRVCARGSLSLLRSSIVDPACALDRRFHSPLGIGFREACATI